MFCGEYLYYAWRFGVTVDVGDAEVRLISVCGIGDVVGSPDIGDGFANLGSDGAHWLGRVGVKGDGFRADSDVVESQGWRLHCGESSAGSVDDGITVGVGYFVGEPDALHGDVEPRDWH